MSCRAKNSSSTCSAFFFPKNDYYFFPDTTGIDALKRNNTELATALVGAWWFSANDKRRMMGESPIDDPAMDKIYIPAGVIPIEAMGGNVEDEL